jgi:hypothetical protein
MSSGGTRGVCSSRRIRHAWKHCSRKNDADVKASSCYRHSMISAWAPIATPSRSARGRLRVSTNKNSKRPDQKRVPYDAPRNKLKYPMKRCLSQRAILCFRLPQRTDWWFGLEMTYPVTPTSTMGHAESQKSPSAERAGRISDTTSHQEC